MKRTRKFHHIESRCFTAALLIAITAGSFASTAAAQDRDKASRPPNIILVMTDDQGYGDLGCHGHPFLKTPHLDSLYAQSTRFTCFHVSPTCSPTRSALMSGRAPFKNGITHTILERDRMTLNATTIAQVLQSAGYTTGIFGKWHLGDADPYQPGNRGFDETFIHGSGGIGQNYAGSQSDAPGTNYFDPIIKHNEKFVQTRGYCTDVFFQQALGWIKAEVTKTDAKPFFCYIPSNAPHGPYIVDEKYSALYRDKCDEQTAKFLGMVANIDGNMGRLMEKLDEWKLSDNTLVIFMTDNGSAAGASVFNAGMKGAKGTPHEGGSRVPLFMRLPGLIQPGIDIDRLARHYDLFPTLAEIAGAEVPAGLDLDGRSLVPLIKNPSVEWPDRNTFFHVGRWPKAGAPGNFGKGDPDPDHSKYKGFAVRNQKWRLVGKELFDMQNDPSQTTNVAEKNPDIVRELMTAYDNWWNEVRPLLINEDASLDVPKPFQEQFQKQKDREGIPEWNPPQLSRQDDAESLNKLWSQGLVEFESGNFKDAQESIEQFIKKIPYEPSSRILMARCQTKLHDPEGAIHSLAKASELGWEDVNSVKSYDEFGELVDRPAFKQTLIKIDENRQRPFVLYIGKSVDRTKAAPLIVLYHGRGELPNIQLHFWKEAADRAGFLLLALKGTRTVGSVYTWDSQNAKHTWQIDTQAILAETNARINEVIQANNISKIVLAGFSQGGVAAIKMLASELQPRPAGGVLFATAFPDQPHEMFADESSIPTCPVIVHVGGNDRWCKGNQAIVDHLKNRGVTIRLRVWHGIGHQMPANHTQVILDSIKELVEGK